MKNPKNMTNEELYTAWFDISHRMILRGLLKPEDIGWKKLAKDEEPKLPEWPNEKKENENA